MFDWKMLQPPCSTPSFLLRRLSKVAQSIDWISAFMPMLRSACAVTGAMLAKMGRSVGCSTTTFSPL
ncbi:hypothetical protein D3C85_1437770 [compost metagenome]